MIKCVIYINTFGLSSNNNKTPYKIKKTLKIYQYKNVIVGAPVAPNLLIGNS